MKSRILLVAFGFGSMTTKQLLLDNNINLDDVEIIEDNTKIELRINKIIEIPCAIPDLNYDTSFLESKQKPNYKPYRSKMTKRR